jgi:hypothetical protein
MRRMRHLFRRLGNCRPSKRHRASHIFNITRSRFACKEKAEENAVYMPCEGVSFYAILSFRRLNSED